MGNIGQTSRRFDVLPLGPHTGGSVPAGVGTERATEPSPSVPAPEPMPAPYPEPVPEPAPIPAPQGALVQHSAARGR